MPSEATMRIDISYRAFDAKPVRLQLVAKQAVPPETLSHPQAASRRGVSSALPRHEGAFAAEQRLPCEREDAHLNGLRRSLQRRVMGLNFPKPELEDVIESRIA